MATKIIYDDTNLNVVDLQIILQAFDIPLTVIDIIIEEYID